MTFGELLTRWTIRLALICYVSVLAGNLFTTDHRRWDSLLRGLWTAGCVIFLVHVACAFHFFYDWSFAIAWRETARRTEEVVGFAWGPGVWFNYLFTLMWVVDVLWWWRGLAAYRQRPWWIHAAFQGFFLFMAFNGAIIFEPGPTRWVGIAVCLALVPAVIVTRLLGRSSSTVGAST